MASKLIDHNPMLKKPVLALLPLCGQMADASRAAVEEAASRLWEPAWYQTPAAVIDALVRTGYVHEQITVDGTPYAGTLEDAYADASVSEDAQIDSLLSVTDAGRDLVRDYAPEATLAALLSDRPAYRPVFEVAVAACSTPEGADRDAIEAAIEKSIASEGITAADGQRIYPQYFIDALETAGGIAWDGIWRATSAGVAAFGQSAPSRALPN